MAHVPRMTLAGYMLATLPDALDPVQVLRCGDCGALVDQGEGSRTHLSWHRSHDNSGPGDASAIPSAVPRGNGW